MKMFLKTLALAVVMALFAACGSDFEWFPEANVAPKANAGANQSVFAGDLVKLDGSASSDENGDKLTYSWSFTSRTNDSTASLSSTTAVSPTFTADKAGSYVLSLIVNDGKINSTAAAVTVTAAPLVPLVANAGADQDVALNQLVTLDGRASTDKRGVTGANGGTLQYNWNWSGTGSKPDGAGSVSLSGADTATPKFTPTVTGTYKITLQVNDLTDLTGDGGTDEIIVRCNLGSMTITW
ncbi:MAG: hypothetical protein CVU66_00180 [Deltaproteobacteria bacterium HGW-Deltaproteobacteria-23]|nr:MAG: hypothetical protein CVU66_00180 [Deltaproteobacteria bacterium HGW-Deltaproteobacteria-23]